MGYPVDRGPARVVLRVDHPSCPPLRHQFSATCLIPTDQTAPGPGRAQLGCVAIRFSGHGLGRGRFAMCDGDASSCHSSRCRIMSTWLEGAVAAERLVRVCARGRVLWASRWQVPAWLRYVCRASSREVFLWVDGRGREMGPKSEQGAPQAWVELGSTFFDISPSMVEPAPLRAQIEGKLVEAAQNWSNSGQVVRSQQPM